MSGYARAAHALGAEVSGSDARRRPVPASGCAADGVLDARVGHAPRTCPRARAWSWSTPRRSRAENAERAAARERGLAERPRAELLGELTRAAAHDRGGGHARQDDDRLDARARAARRRACDPGWLVGGPVGGGLRERASGARASGWSSRPTSPTARCSACSVEIARADERRARPPRDASARSRSCARRSASSSRGPRAGGRLGPARAARAARAAPVRRLRRARRSTLDARAARAFAGAGTRCALRGARRAQRAQRRRRARGGARSPAPTPARRDRGPRRLSAAPGGAFSCSARSAARRAASTTTTPTTRPRSRRRCAAARTLEHRRLVAVFQPHLYSRTALLAREFGARAGAAPTWSSVLDVYPARERAEDHPGRERPADRRGRAPTRRAGRPVYWLPTLRRRRAGARASCSARATCAW